MPKLNYRQQQKHIDNINVAKIFKRLGEQALGDVNMKMTDIRAAEILLRKCVPDLKSTEFIDKSPQNITFQFFGEPNVQPKAVQGRTIDANAIEDQSKGDAEIVDTVATEGEVVTTDKQD